MSEDKQNINISGTINIGNIRQHYSGESLKYSSMVDSTSVTLEKEFIEQLKNEPEIMQQTINFLADVVKLKKFKLNYSVDYADIPAIFVLNYAVEVFENNEIAENWLKRQNRALGGAIPLDLLDTKEGVEQVYQLLNRIEYGVYS